MADPYLSLSPEDRVAALGVAATATGRADYLLEKDIWVVWALQGLFESELGAHLVFKGGTSLSKAYDITERFSEDVDLTYDIRELLPDLATGNPPIPQTNSQAKKWTDAARARLPVWVNAKVLPVLVKHATASGVDVKFRVEEHNIYIDYTRLTNGPAYVPPSVKLEFGARSTGDPSETRSIVCDVAKTLPALDFPTARPKVMLPKRTFWEKATAVHVFCAQGEIKGSYSRHWYDLVKLDDKEFAQAALEDRALAKEVADWKSKFFRERDREGNWVDYSAAVSGKLQLVPNANLRKELGTDYKAMIDAGLFVGEPVAFDDLMKRCETMQKRANDAA